MSPPSPTVPISEPTSSLAALYHGKAYHQSARFFKVLSAAIPALFLSTYCTPHISPKLTHKLLRDTQRTTQTKPHEMAFITTTTTTTNTYHVLAMAVSHLPPSSLNTNPNTKNPMVSRPASPTKRTQFLDSYNHAETPKEHDRDSFHPTNHHIRFIQPEIVKYPTPGKDARWVGKLFSGSHLSWAEKVERARKKDGKMGKGNRLRDF
ncbi:hypothetical protein BU16DRAFT_533622 [Lophium mytilinum]|uniref:Uncharacterized protein n=1 Tax=Lophium mytilinum TaxID=390894 RepID=A0A6A6RG93_9PEZI|nr:hypothetical protein BU16DRAFT_533622 [Lophium mytilinum]